MRRRFSLDFENLKVYVTGSPHVLRQAPDGDGSVFGRAPGAHGVEIVRRMQHGRADVGNITGRAIAAARAGNTHALLRIGLLFNGVEPFQKTRTGLMDIVE